MCINCTENRIVSSLSQQKIYATDYSYIILSAMRLPMNIMWAIIVGVRFDFLFKQVGENLMQINTECSKSPDYCISVASTTPSVFGIFSKLKSNGTKSGEQAGCTNKYLEQLLKVLNNGIIFYHYFQN